MSQESAISKRFSQGNMVTLRVVFKKAARSLQVITGLRKMRKECACGTWHRGGFTKKLRMLKFGDAYLCQILISLGEALPKQSKTATSSWNIKH